MSIDPDTQETLEKISRTLRSTPALPSQPFSCSCKFLSDKVVFEVASLDIDDAVVLRLAMVARAWFDAKDGELVVETKQSPDSRSRCSHVTFRRPYRERRI